MRARIDRIHLVGIGGAGMSALAELLHAEGYRVSGSDLSSSPATQRLGRLGVEVAVGHAADRIRAADLVVVSSAIPPDNPELVEAARRGLPRIRRGEMLAELMRPRLGVAVAGSHGKTTTASLIVHILECSGREPSAAIGARLLSPAGHASGARTGSGDVFVAEADESDGSFLCLSPAIAVITNIDAEHLDHHGSLEDLLAAFAAFANRVPFWGAAIVCADHPGVQALRASLIRRTVAYGMAADADLRADSVRVDGDGMRFRVRESGAASATLRLPLPGLHNVRNAVAALAVARELGLTLAEAAAALEDFPGVERRFQCLGEADGVRVVDDYGHHPAEVRATLAAARAAHSGRIAVVFQPHRYSRTRDCFEDFVRAFDDADLLVITEIYAAGEPALPGVDGRSLAEKIRARGHPDVRFIASLEEVAAQLPGLLREGDWLISQGAGDVASLGPALLRQLASRESAL